MTNSFNNTFTTNTSPNSLAPWSLFWSIYMLIASYFQERREYEQKQQACASEEDTGLALDPKRPFDSALAFLKSKYLCQGITTLRYYDKDYWRWERNTYCKVETAEIEKEIMFFLSQGVVVLCPCGRSEAFPVAPRHITEIEKLLRRLLHVPKDETPPCWIHDSGCKQPLSVTDCTLLLFGKSRTLYLESMEILPPTPLWFNTASLDYDYDPTATCPIWDAFLDSIFGDDEESKAAVMEFMGLCLTTITKFQKALFLVGPKRGGKGTIARITEALVGKHNSTSQSTSDFSQQFGFSSFIGKTFVCVSDARFNKQGLTRATEKILNIVGEDLVKVNRKFKDSLDRRLTVKIMLLANMVPDIPDPSGALPSRFIFVKLTESFYKKEDANLPAKLLRELPGILNLVIKHLKNLLERGHFIQPKSGEQLSERMMELSSPVSKFIELLEPYSHPDIIWGKWIKFCIEEGFEQGKKPALWRDLVAAGYECDFDAARILAKVRKDGEATAHDLRACSRKFKEADVLDRKLREMVKEGLLKRHTKTTGNNRVVEVFSVNPDWKAAV